MMRLTNLGLTYAILTNVKIILRLLLNYDFDNFSKNIISFSKGCCKQQYGDQLMDDYKSHKKS